jgi:hypothetical protein
LVGSQAAWARGALRTAAVAAAAVSKVARRVWRERVAGKAVRAAAGVAGELVEFVFRVQLMSSPRFRGKSHAVVKNAALRPRAKKGEASGGVSSFGRGQ